MFYFDFYDTNKIKETKHMLANIKEDIKWRRGDNGIRTNMQVIIDMMITTITLDLENNDKLI